MAQLPFAERPFSPLPAEYGRDMLVARPRDSRRLFLCWELAADTFGALRERMGWAPASLVLRIVSDDGMLQESAVRDWLGQRYVHDLPPGTSLWAELGLLEEGGNFTALIRSSHTQMPAAV